MKKKSLKKVNTFFVANQFYIGIGYKTQSQAKKEMQRLNNIKNKFCYHIDRRKMLTNDLKLI